MLQVHSFDNTIVLHTIVLIDAILHAPVRMAILQLLACNHQTLIAIDINCNFVYHLF